MEYTTNWERLGKYCERLKVPHGWIVTVWYSCGGAAASVHQIFILDELNEWKLEIKEEE